MEFLGREKELYEMNRLYQKDGFQLFILYGRRRVGKTTLLKEFCKGKNTVFYSAEQTNDTMNLRKFSALIFEHYGQENLSDFSSWENALQYIYNMQQNERLVLVIDEFPYLANINHGLMSLLQHQIDHYFNESQLYIILCGSYMGFMEKEVLGAKSPLFGRRTAQLHMKPLDYRTSARFLTGFSTEEKLIIYGICGGTPLYLNQFTSTLSLEENIKDIFLKTTGYLYEEPILLLRQEVQEPGIYCAVIEAVARGAVRSNEIAAKTGEEAAKCIKYMTILQSLGILFKELPLGVHSSSRRTLHGICDPMFSFWYRYISPNRTLLETDAYDVVWEKKIKPDLPVYMGHMFERICQEYLLWKNKTIALPFLFTEIGRWWGTDSASHQEVEIDIVARDKDNILFGECKWRNEKLDFSVLKELQRKAAAFPHGTEQKWYILFSKSGFSEAIHQEAGKDNHILLVTLNDMF